MASTNSYTKYLARYWFPALKSQTVDTTKAVSELQNFVHMGDRKVTTDAILRYMYTDLHKEHPYVKAIARAVDKLQKAEPELFDKLKAFKFENDLLAG